MKIFRFPTGARTTAAILFFATLVCNVGQISGQTQETTDPSVINSETNALFIEQVSATPADEPFVFRVDELTDELVERAKNEIASEQVQINFVMNGLRVTSLWSDVLYNPETGEADLSLFVAAMLGLLPGSYGVGPYPGFLESREQAQTLESQGNRNYTAEILAHYRAVEVEYSPPGSTSSSSRSLDPAPVYQVSYGYANATNAKTTGIFQDGTAAAGRCNIILNLGAEQMLEEDYFAIATIHETWHCYHAPTNTSPNTLLKNAMREGVVTYLTAVVLGSDLNDETQVADLLFWSLGELDAAQERKEELVSAFAEVRDVREPSEQREWMVLGVPNTVVQGAPARAAYYIGWLAVQAYVEDVIPGRDSPASTDLAKTLLDQADTLEGCEEMFLALQTRMVNSSNPGDEDPSMAAPKISRKLLFLVAALFLAWML